MSENKIDNRGSKSKCTELTTVKNKFVKAQRLDDSFCRITKFMQIRYNLMGLETGYQINNLSKQLNKLSFSTLNTKPKLNP